MASNENKELNIASRTRSEVGRVSLPSGVTSFRPPRPPETTRMLTVCRFRAGSAYGRGVAIPTTITCVDCGGVCSLISYEPDEGWEPGDIVAFRCQDCLDRWDVELTAEDICD